MVFANLPPREKDAFFSLLDEYFQSRPDLIPSPSAPESTGAGAAAASAVHRAMASNPEATSRLVSSGLKHGVPKGSPYAAAANNPEINSAAGRFAAASMSFNQNKASPPPAPPRRASSNNSANEGQDPPSIASTGNSRGLSSVRKFGDVDTSSAKNLFGSLRSSTTNKTATPPPVAAPLPGAFAAKKNAFAPPPVRRVASTASQEPARRQEEEEEEEEVDGEWAEALYEYSSKDAGDLQLQTNQRVLVTERTSDDWWTGEANGKKGLFPASYVKLM